MIYMEHVPGQGQAFKIRGEVIRDERQATDVFLAGASGRGWRGATRLQQMFEEGIIGIGKSKEEGILLMCVTLTGDRLIRPRGESVALQVGRSGVGCIERAIAPLPPITKWIIESRHCIPKAGPRHVQPRAAWVGRVQSEACLARRQRRAPVRSMRRER